MLALAAPPADAPLADAPLASSPHQAPLQDVDFDQNAGWAEAPAAPAAAPAAAVLAPAAPVLAASTSASASASQVKMLRLYLHTYLGFTLGSTYLP